MSVWENAVVTDDSPGGRVELFESGSSFVRFLSPSFRLNDGVDYGYVGFGIDLIFNGVEQANGISYTGSTIIPENTATSTVLLTFSLVGGSGSYTYSITSGNGAGKFSISTNTLVLAGALDFESVTSYTLTIEADNGVDTPTDRIVTISVSDVDEVPPTITSSSTDTNAENTALAHLLTANESVTWSVIGGADQSKFEISGSTLRWSSNGTKDYEAPDDANTDNAYVVQVRATDLAGNTTDQTITVTVTDVDDTAPTITSASTANNTENTHLSHSLTANESVLWSLVGGADVARFELLGSTLRWASNGTKDFEAPNDSNTNNTYIVTVRATDLASNHTDQTVTITVVNDPADDPDVTAPTITSSAFVSNDEGVVLAHSLTANETVTWSIVGGVDQARLELSGSTLRWAGNGVKNFSAPNDSDANNTYIVTVRATDLSTNHTDQSITVTVHAVTLDFSGSATVPEDTEAGSSLGTFAVTGGTGSYSFDFDTGGNPGGKFSIAGDTLLLDSSLDFETTPSYDLVILADNGVTSPLTLNLTINVGDVAEGAATGSPIGLLLALTHSPEPSVVGSPIGLLFTLTHAE